MRNLKLMPDYGCYPLWETLDSGLDNINPERLGISRDLAEALNHWACEYDAILNMDDPADSRFPSEESELRFESMGRHLFEALQRELGGKFTVSYFSQKAGKLYR